MNTNINAQTEQSINATNPSRTRRGFGKLKPLKPLVKREPKPLTKRVPKPLRPLYKPDGTPTRPLKPLRQSVTNNELQQSIFMQSSGSNTGIASLSFTDVQCNGDYLTDKKQVIIEKLLEAARGARGLLHHEQYKPLPKPMMWTLSTIDFGVMVDAVALSDADILARADKIMTKLCRDCDLFVLEFGGVQ